MLCGNYIRSNRSEWTFYFLSSVQFNFTISVFFFNIKLEFNTMIKRGHRNIPLFIKCLVG
ncbi:hypothetical protein EFP97_02065 [Lactobacillus helveticus]|nr:hypothetical protein [Lactobacillus helveticus]MBW8063167.1 hypothetical protein [Lactobacillus helveticus]MCT3407391.1 hypothetical protein [Lactobacillus helveticus]MCT3412442.1 hypothetical protein [Lactobacillus helveticus]MCT3417420.1 hypothetical protein [Lactobacillus helveticus]